MTIWVLDNGCTKESVQGGAPPYRNNFIGRASSGRNEIRRLKTDPQLTAHSSLFCKTLASSFAKRPQPYTIWRESTHAVKVPTKETFRTESWQIDFLRASSRHWEANLPPKGIPWNTSRNYDYSCQSAAPGFPQTRKGTKQQISCQTQLRASNNYLHNFAELVVLIFKSKDSKVLCSWSAPGRPFEIANSAIL